MHEASSHFKLHNLLNLLHNENLLELAQAEKIQRHAEQENLSVISFLVQNNILSSEIIIDCLKRIFGLPLFDLKDYDFNWLKNSVINLELICRYRIIPLYCDQHHLQIALSDPTDQTIVSILGFQTNLSIKLFLVLENDLNHFINKYCQTNFIYSNLIKIQENTEQSSPEIMTEQEDEPLIEFVNQLLKDAMDKNISDIHIEPQADNCRIRFRRDGLLYEAAQLPAHLTSRLITRLKIMTNLNIAEKRLPQDGRMKINYKKMDVRINTCPSIYGEKLVLRLLHVKNFQFDINYLGFTSEQQELFLHKISQPQGLVLVTGPTGSGKTITLYSALQFLNQIEKNISTVEDPVEIELPGITQININPRIGLDFAASLRSLLRQDPDIIMIGEIRDKETAMIAMQAAQTGHLVLATLHTNSAIDTINRLKAINIDSYSLISAVSLIIAQRLVRKLCVHCHANSHDCQHCHQGYLGRTGIFECLQMTEPIVRLIFQHNSHSQINAYLKKTNWLTLQKIGLEKVTNGITSYEELKRVLGNVDESI
jgi:type IV pilus assembly protein PilB